MSIPGLLHQIDAGVLNVGYADVGPSEGPAVVLLHGWPYDINSFAADAPLLAERGYRVIVPYLRGFGTTRFLADDTVRNGQQSAPHPDPSVYAAKFRGTYSHRTIVGGIGHSLPQEAPHAFVAAIVDVNVDTDS